MKLSFPAAAAAAIVLGAALSPALAQDAQAPAQPPVAQPQAAAPADPQPTQPVVRPAGSRGGCAWKSKNLTS